MECKNNVDRTISLVDGLGLTVHPEKSILNPTQHIDFVGFTLNSVDMTVMLTIQKCENIIMECKKVLSKKSITIRDFAKLIGKMVASAPGVKYAPLYYKSLEIQRDLELKMHKGNFDKVMYISWRKMRCVLNGGLTI